MKLRVLGLLGVALLVVAIGLGVGSMVGQADHMTSALPADMLQHQTMMGGGMMSGAMMGGGMMSGAMMGSMGLVHHLVPTLFWGGLLLLTVWGVLTYLGRSTAALAPLTILQRRYASGEISREQYEEVRSGLAN